MKLLRWIPLVLAILVVGYLFYCQRGLEKDFRGHWHYAPVANHNVEIATRRISDNVPYHLTERPKPKTTESAGYIYWYGCWR